MSMFEVKIANSENDRTQNVAGKFGTGTGDTFVAAACAAGTLCVTNGLLPLEGYESFDKKNHNSFYFNVAASGSVDGLPADRTGIYACNSYDVNKATDAFGNSYNKGADTYGISTPAGERVTMTELEVGETYAFDVDNFTATPADGETYATIADGVWTPSDSAPAAGTGVYGEIIDTDNINVGAYYIGKRYWVKIFRTAAA